MTLSSAQRLATPAVAIIAGWLVAGIFFGWQYNLVMRSQQFNLHDRIASTIPLVLLWTLCTPIVFRFADWFPLRRPYRLRNAVLLSVTVILFAAFRSCFDLFLLLLINRQLLHEAGFIDHALLLFHTQLPFTIALVGIANFLRIERESGAVLNAETRLEAELARARLRQLRSDLHPHFLFNALNGVAALVHTDPAAAEQALRNLTQLLRSSVASQEQREVPLSEELEFISRYLDIQKMRFGAKLQTAIEISDPRLRAAAVPPLLLQPLVENSIIHGIGRRRDGGRVVVAVDAVGEWLRMQVRDNGPGSDSDPTQSSGSIGVPNAKARLEAIYGERHALTYERRGDEYTAEVRIPLRMTEAS